MNDLTKLQAEWKKEREEIHARHEQREEDIRTQRYVTPGTLHSDRSSLLTQAKAQSRLLEILNPIKDKPMGRQFCSVCLAAWSDENEWHQGHCHYDAAVKEELEKLNGQ